MIELQTITNYDKFSSLKQEWNELVANSEDAHAFFTHDWFECWWQAFGNEKQLLILTIKKDEEIVAIMPLMTGKSKLHGLTVKTIQFMANDDSPRSDIILKKNFSNVDEIIAKLYNHLSNEQKNWRLLFLGNIHKDSKTMQALLRLLNKQKAKYTSDSKLFSPWVSITTDWETYYDTLKRRAKMTVNNVRNRIHKLGEINIKESCDADQLEMVASISKNAWKFTEGKSFLNRDDRHNFFKLLTAAAQKHGWLSLRLLTIGSKPVAYEYHLRYDKRVIALLAEYDQEYYKSSPGAFLDFNIMKQMFERDIVEYDLGGSFDQYKKKWKPNLRVTDDYYIYNNSLYSLFLFFIDKRIIVFFRNLKKQLDTLLPTAKRFFSKLLPTPKR